MIAVIICGLAGWRVAVLFVREDGPFGICLKLRELVGIVDTPAGVIIRNSYFAQVLSCVWCASVYSTAMAYGVHEWADVRWPVQLVAAMALPVALDIYGRKAA